MTEEKDPKIIVDDDWKSQVEKEKEQIEQERHGDDDNQQVPEASFSLLVTTFATQALSAMGFMPNPVTGKAEPNKALAKHFIDSLSILQEKTSGNLTKEESELMNDALHQLRMAFVSIDQMPTSDTNEDDAPKSSIELP